MRLCGLTNRVSVAPGSGAGRAGRRPNARRVTLPAATPSMHLNSQAATGGAARGDSCKRQLGRSFHRTPDRRARPIYCSQENPMTPLVLANEPDNTCGAKRTPRKLLPGRCGSTRRQSRGRPSNQLSTTPARKAPAQLSSGHHRPRETGNHLTLLVPTCDVDALDREAARRRVAHRTAACVVRDLGNTGIDGLRR